MGNTQNIDDIFRTLMKGNDEIYSVVCEVKSVNGEFADLKPVFGEADIFDVRLLAGSATTPLMITPEVGSKVVATFLSKDTAFVTMYSDIKKIRLRGDQYGGLVKIEKLVDKINQLEEKVNDIVTSFNGHIHTTTATVGPSALPGVIAPTKSLETPIVPTTQKSDLENDTVLHG